MSDYPFKAERSYLHICTSKGEDSTRRCLLHDYEFDFTDCLAMSSHLLHDGEDVYDFEFEFTHPLPLSREGGLVLAFISGPNWRGCFP